MSVRVLQGDCRETLKGLADASVNCCVTSPPYWGLRDYGHAGQIGQEKSPEEFVAALVSVFREVRRVLKDDGTLWLNLGDSYAGSGTGQGPNGSCDPKQPKLNGMKVEVPDLPDGLKAKDLVGIPWRVAFALQADGWWLRQDIIWHKPNPMPESVTDRCTKAHEYIFLLSKSARYFYDAEAIAEAVAESSIERLSRPNLENQAGSLRVPGKTNGPMKAVLRKREKGNGESAVDTKMRGYGSCCGVTEKRNKRSVWTVTTKPYREAHFATFPPELVRPAILAGCPRGGTVLDPFGGSGTTGEVAEQEGRHSILCELNPKYVELIEKRTAQGGLLHVA